MFNNYSVCSALAYVLQEWDVRPHYLHILHCTRDSRVQFSLNTCTHIHTQPHSFALLRRTPNIMMALQCDLMHRHKSDTSAYTQNAPRVGGCVCASAGRFATGLIFIFGRHSFSSRLSYRHRTPSAARVGAEHMSDRTIQSSYTHHIHTTFAIMCTVLRLMQNDIRWKKWIARRPASANGHQRLDFPHYSTAHTAIPVKYVFGFLFTQRALCVVDTNAI